VRTLAGASRCGIDSVAIARIARLLEGADRAALLHMFAPVEVDDAGGDGAGARGGSDREARDGGDGSATAAAGAHTQGTRARLATLAGRFAAKEACAKLFPRELGLGAIAPTDFAIARNAYGAPELLVTPKLEQLLARHRLARIEVSITHDDTHASAVALGVPVDAQAPLAGRLLHALVPIRRRIVHENLRHVFGAVTERDVRRLAQAHYAHLWRLAAELVRFRFLSPAQTRALVRVENLGAFVDAFTAGKGVLVLTGHFGNWEVATVAGIASYPEVNGRFHFVRRPIKPRWLDALVTARFRRAGFGVLGKRGSLDDILARLEAGDVVVFPFDQFAHRPDGIDVEFFGQPVGTFKSLAVLALATGAAVVPAASWREPDGTHVLRFEPALAHVDHPDTSEAIRRATRSYNAALEALVLRHPEQWWWMHRRFRRAGKPGRRTGKTGSAGNAPAPGASAAGFATSDSRRAAKLAEAAVREPAAREAAPR
jgi:KDO2-lipid IV(A) lauroyltransferase